MRPIVPIAHLQRRIPEAGRIRTGIAVEATSKKGAKYDRPQAIETFRFTSSDQEAIEQIAATYGGTPRPWEKAPTPGQWEVISEASEIRIVLPPDPMGQTPIYELWSGGGCERRCDGYSAQVIGRGPEGPEMTEVPCICVSKGEMACSPHTRLSVILPEIRFAGTWRYQSSSSMAVAVEMPGMVEMVQSLQERSLTRALLAIEHRKSVVAGQTHRFTIPVIRIAESMDALASGAARVGALGNGSQPPAALGSGEEPESQGSGPTTADDVIDAEVVEDKQASYVLAKRLLALPEKEQQRAEKLRTSAKLPSLDDELSAEQAEQWEGLLRGMEAAAAHG